MKKLRKQTHLQANLPQEKINMLFAGFGSVCIVKNSDLGLENASLGLLPWSHFFIILTDPKPTNNIYLFRFIFDFQIC